MSELTIEQWIEEVNNSANEKALELKSILNAEIIPVIYVIEPLKDVAIGYLRKPDAKQAMKIIRSLGDNYEMGVELMCRAQLVRGVEGFAEVASDVRFMDVNGNYPAEWSDINLNLMLDAKNKLITLYVDQFKKK